ncbi:MAG: spore protease YyaC [Lachnospiraceae bacterium]
MKVISQENVYYFNPSTPYAVESFSECLRGLIDKNRKRGQKLVILCIGTDRVMGDCLGPLLGYRLKKTGCSGIIYGDLDSPVHAKNIPDVVKEIKKKHPRAFIIAIDASLGTQSHIGYITLGVGSLRPGAGVGKKLPKVGNLYITGIVNCLSPSHESLLNDTRLNVVMSLADTIYEGIQNADLFSSAK